jgi:uracil-DNA glycosylase
MQLPHLPSLPFFPVESSGGKLSSLQDGFAADQLMGADPRAWPVDAGWQATVDTFFASPQGQALLDFLRTRLGAGATIFPPQPLRALALTPPEAVRVVILGQDPYHGRGQAEGLAFSVAQGLAVPPSLRNIFRELGSSGAAAQAVFPPAAASLLAWAERGVLLLNTCLTVEEGQAASHAKRGWEALTDAIIRTISLGTQPVVFMLWGAHAQSKQSLIDASRHLVLSANHPSPLSASRPPVPFIGCGHFREAAAWLEARQRTAAR